MNENVNPSDCTCGPWNSVLPPPPCPVHSCTCAHRCPCCGAPYMHGWWWGYPPALYWTGLTTTYTSDFTLTVC